MLSLIVAFCTINRWICYENCCEEYPIGDIDMIGSFNKYTFINYIFILSILICELYLVFVRLVNWLIA